LIQDLAPALPLDSARHRQRHLVSQRALHELHAAHDAPRSHGAVAAVYGAQIVDGELGDIEVVQKLALFLRQRAQGSIHGAVQSRGTAFAVQLLVGEQRRRGVDVLAADDFVHEALPAPLTRALSPEEVDGDGARHPAQPALEGAFPTVAADARLGTDEEPIADLLEQIVDDVWTAVKPCQEGAEGREVGRLEQVEGAPAALAAGNAQVERADLGRQRTPVAELVEVFTEVLEADVDCGPDRPGKFVGSTAFSAGIVHMSPERYGSTAGAAASPQA
jgi:hypothetical protein